MSVLFPITLHDMGPKERDFNPSIRPHKRSMHTDKHNVFERRDRSMSPQTLASLPIISVTFPYKSLGEVPWVYMGFCRCAF